MGIAFDGLASGLDTTGLINSLMKLEGIPQTLLKTKVTTTQSMITALQGLNTKIASLATLAKAAAKPTSLDLFSATSSSKTLTATVGKGASAGQLDVVVDKLAQKQTTVSAAVSEWSETDFSIKRGDGAVVNISAASTSLDDVITAINNSDAGVAAMKVASGKDPITNETLYRLQFTAKESGEADKFNIEGTATALNETRAGQDAELTLWAGTSAAQTVTSASNTFSDLLPGVSVTVNELSAAPITLTVARDAESATKVAEDLVSALNGVFALIDTKSAVNTSTGADGNSAASGGVFTGDSLIRDVKQKILSAATMPVDGRSPSEVGISITKAGVIEFDADKFAKALTEDPARVQRVIQEISGRVETAASVASDKYNGVLTSKVKGQESLVKNYSTQVAEWDTRLTNRRSTLERTYAALEVALSKMNSQSSYLASQLGSLPTGSN